MHNPEYDINIGEHLKICDYGNIQIDDGLSDMKALMSKLSKKVSLCVGRGNIPFIVGGSRDLLQAVCESENSPTVFLSISPNLDLEQQPTQDLCHQSSVHTHLINHGKKILAFGVDGSRVSAVRIPQDS
jgi:arginase family enzyme